MADLQQMVFEVEQARQRILDTVQGLTTEQGAFQEDPQRWSIAQILEHLVLAEQVGINGMWKAAQACRHGQPLWRGNSPHLGLSIEAVVEKTWRPQEVAPDVAAPRLGGPLGYWMAAFRSCRQLLQSLQAALQGLDLSEVVYPHPLSGPLDARQRLEFLRFHMDRHLGQIRQIIQHPAFPLKPE